VQNTFQNEPDTALEVDGNIVTSKTVTEKCHRFASEIKSQVKKSWNKSQENIILFKLSVGSLPVFPNFTGK